MTATWRLVDPVAARRLTEADRVILRTTPVRRIGFLDNHKANAGELQRAIGRLLERRFDLEQRFYAKPTASLAAPQDLIDRIRDECDVVLVGSAD